MTKKPQAHVRVARWSPARPVLVTLWGLTIFLSIYNAKGIRDEIDKSDWLRDYGWLRDGVTLVMRLSDAIGVSALREYLGTIRDTINDSYTVLEAGIGDVGGRDDADSPLVETASQLNHHVARRPRRVLIIGASSIQFAIGVELEKRLPRDYEGLTVKRYGQLATGLSRPDFMNWPEKLRSLAEPFKPDLVICNFGGNDAQSIPVGDYRSVEYDTPEWEGKYGERVTEMIDIAREYGADTVMIGMPIMRSRTFSKKMRRLNRVMKKVTEEAGMLFVPTYEKASTEGGDYRTTVTFRGQRGLMRTSDGVHYTRLGARFIIEHVMREIERRYRFVPKDEDLARSERHGYDSPTLNQTVWYTAYVPQGQAEPRPAAVLLPGPDDWAEWPQYPHRELQRWAQARQAVLVVPEDAHRRAYVGPFAAVLRDELPRDLERTLPVSSVAFAGSGRSAVSALAAGTKSFGLLVYRPWVDPSNHRDDPALVEALGAPAATTGPWGSNGWASERGPLVWLQASPRAEALRRVLGQRLLDAGRPAKTFDAALEAGLPVLVPPPQDDIPPIPDVPR